MFFSRQTSQAKLRESGPRVHASVVMMMESGPKLIGGKRPGVEEAKVQTEGSRVKSWYLREEAAER